MKICVIGAGPAGLTAAKEFILSGFEVDVYEKQSGLGGLWNFNEHTPGVSASTCATSSKEYLQFSDYPIAEGTPHFVHYTEYLTYLTDYARHFNVLQHISYEHEVVRIKQDGEGWCVAFRSKGVETEKFFDRVAICSGLHQTAKEFEVTGVTHVSNKIIHSSMVKHVDQFKGKTVLVVGGGESGADLAHEISAIAKKTYLSLRRGLVTLPRWHYTGQRKFPADFDASRAVYWLPPPYKHDLFTQSESPFRCILGLMSLPLVLVYMIFDRKLYWPLVRKMLSLDFYRPLIRKHIRHGPPSGIDLSQACEAIAADSSLDIRRKVILLSNRFEWFSGAMHASQPFTKSPEFLEDIATGRLQVVPTISSFNHDGSVNLEKGVTLEVDIIVSCTGYETKVSFLDPQTLDGRSLYKHVFVPELTGLAFIGFVRPNTGALPPLAEVQARWVSGVWLDRYRLPSERVQKRNVAEDANTYNEQRPLHRHRLSSLVDYHEYISDLARRIGCHPRLWRLIRHPALLMAVMLGPFSGYQFRLHGPGANWQAANQAAALIDIRNCLSSRDAGYRLYFYVTLRPVFWFLSRICRIEKFLSVY